MRQLYTIPAVLLCILFLGCEEEEISPILTEPATVLEVIYSPAQHGSGVGPTLDITGSGGIGIAITSVSVKEKFAIVFQCPHGKFIIEGGKKHKAKELWGRLKNGQEVTVSYQEIYRTTYENGEPIKRVLVKYQFIDAV